MTNDRKKLYDLIYGERDAELKAQESAAKQEMDALLLKWTKLVNTPLVGVQHMALCDCDECLAKRANARKLWLPVMHVNGNVEVQTFDRSNASAAMEAIVEAICADGVVKVGKVTYDEAKAQAWCDKHAEEAKQLAKDNERFEGMF